MVELLLASLAGRFSDDRELLEDDSFQGFFDRAPRLRGEPSIFEALDVFITLCIPE